MGPALAEYFLLERVEPGIDDGAPSGVSDVARRSIKRRYTASQRCSGVSVSDTWTSLVAKPAPRARSCSQRAKNVLPLPYSPRTALNAPRPRAAASSSASNVA